MLPLDAQFKLNKIKQTKFDLRISDSAVSYYEVVRKCDLGFCI